MIALFLPDLRGGGAERVSIDLARGFAVLGHEVEFVLLSSTGEFSDEVTEQFPVEDLKISRVRDAIRPVYSYIRARRPTLVVAMMWPLTAIVPLAAKMGGFSGAVLVCEHGILSQQYKQWGFIHRVMLRASTIVGYRLATARVGVSTGAAIDMARLAWLDESEVTAIHNPVRSMQRREDKALGHVNALWPRVGARVLNVGALKSVKNQELLVRAFARLENRQACLMLLGQGRDREALDALAKQLGVRDRVVFAGFHSDPSPFYATADLFVLSSDHEGFGNVIVEALSFGLPVVSTDCPSGPAEILENGRWGRLVPVGDAEALARAMEAALSEPVDREALKRRAADFAPEIAARKYLDLLGLP